MTEADLKKAATMIRDYCHNTSCSHCVFVRDWDECPLCDEPKRWIIEDYASKDISKYEPYDFSSEWDRSLLRDKWIFSKEKGTGCMRSLEGKIIGFADLENLGWRALVASCYPSSYNFTFSEEELFESFVFEGGYPIGVLKEKTS